MHKKLWLSAFLMSLAFGGCYNYEPINDGPYDDSMAQGTDNVDFGNYSLIYIQDGDLYGFDPNLLKVKKIFSVDRPILRFQVNADHSRIAYQTSNYVIEVIDLNGKQLDWFATDVPTILCDWHPNNRSLVTIENNRIVKVYGSPVVHSEVDFTNVGGIYDFSIDDALIMPNGDVLYCYRYTSDFEEYKAVLAVEKMDGGYEGISSALSYNSYIKNNLLSSDSAFEKVVYQYLQSDDSQFESNPGYDKYHIELYGLSDDYTLEETQEKRVSQGTLKRLLSTLSPDQVLITYEEDSYSFFSFLSNTRPNENLLDNVTQIDW